MLTPVSCRSSSVPTAVLQLLLLALSTSSSTLVVSASSSSLSSSLNAQISANDAFRRILSDTVLDFQSILNDATGEGGSDSSGGFGCFGKTGLTSTQCDAAHDAGCVWCNAGDAAGLCVSSSQGQTINGLDLPHIQCEVEPDDPAAEHAAWNDMAGCIFSSSSDSCLDTPTSETGKGCQWCRFDLEKIGTSTNWTIDFTQLEPFGLCMSSQFATDYEQYIHDKLDGNTTDTAADASTSMLDNDIVSCISSTTSSSSPDHETISEEIGLTDMSCVMISALGLRSMCSRTSDSTGQSCTWIENALGMTNKNLCLSHKQYEVYTGLNNIIQNVGNDIITQALSSTTEASTTSSSSSMVDTLLSSVQNASSSLLNPYAADTITQGIQAIQGTVSNISSSIQSALFSSSSEEDINGTEINATIANATEYPSEDFDANATEFPSSDDVNATEFPSSDANATEFPSEDFDTNATEVPSGDFNASNATEFPSDDFDANATQFPTSEGNITNMTMVPIPEDIENVAMNGSISEIVAFEDDSTGFQIDVVKYNDTNGTDHEEMLVESLDANGTEQIQVMIINSTEVDANATESPSEDIDFNATDFNATTTEFPSDDNATSTEFPSDEGNMTMVPIPEDIERVAQNGSISEVVAFEEDEDGFQVDLVEYTDTNGTDHEEMLVEYKDNNGTEQIQELDATNATEYPSEYVTDNSTELTLEEFEEELEELEEDMEYDDDEFGNSTNSSDWGEELTLEEFEEEIDEELEEEASSSLSPSTSDGDDEGEEDTYYEEDPEEVAEEVEYEIEEVQEEEEEGYRR